MRMAALRIRRFSPGTDLEPSWREYRVPWGEGETILSALMGIYEREDSTLAFGYGCRYKTCGLCAVEVDGVPRLACVTPLPDGAKVGPLHNLPLLRDLVVDRGALFEDLRRWSLHLPVVVPPDAPVAIQVTPEHRRLMDCVECLGCQATCHRYDHADTNFGGPYLFVKLAQLHTHPSDRIDRRAQAREAGIEACRDCGRCHCVIGVPIVHGAIAELLPADTGAE